VRSALIGLVHRRMNLAGEAHFNRLAAAYGMNELGDARKAVEAVFDELLELNDSAAGSLAEGIDETLTVHRLGLKGDLKRQKMEPENRSH
jgi:hypothetical protein